MSAFSPFSERPADRRAWGFETPGTSQAAGIRAATGGIFGKLPFVGESARVPSRALRNPSRTIKPSRSGRHGRRAPPVACPEGSGGFLPPHLKIIPRPQSILHEGDWRPRCRSFVSFALHGPLSSWTKPGTPRDIGRHSSLATHHSKGARRPHSRRSAHTQPPREGVGLTGACFPNFELQRPGRVCLQ